MFYKTWLILFCMKCMLIAFFFVTLPTILLKTTNLYFLTKNYSFMINKQSRLFVWLFLAMFGMAQSALAADFKDFSVIVNNQTGTLLTTEEQEQGTSVNFGVAVADDGTVIRVEAGDASSVATVSGTYHSDHGCTGLQVVVPVAGTVKISVGQCTYITIPFSEMERSNITLLVSI